MEEILKYLPFNTYSDLFNAIFTGKANLKILRADCLEIAKLKHPNCILGLFVGFVVTTILLIFLSIKFSYYSLLTLIPINLILTYIIIYIPIIKKISWIILVIDLFIIKMPYFFFIASITTLLISFFYNLWWNKVYRYAIYEMQYNEEAFLWAWNRCGISIEDCYGNSFSKLSMRKNDIQNITVKNEDRK